MNRALRIGAFAVAFLSILAFPPWVAVGIAAIMNLRFRATEMLIIGVCADLLYLPSGGVPLFTLLMVVILWGFEPMRRELL